jgi:quinol monooxygenase YgiN
MPSTLIVVHVQVRVKPEADAIQAFRAATIANARASRGEPGVARFDAMQDRDDPTRWVLVEAYRSAEAVAAHKETAHYLAWRDTVAELMAEPRSSRKFVNVDPGDDGW